MTDVSETAEELLCYSLGATGATTTRPLQVEDWDDRESRESSLDGFEDEDFFSEDSEDEYLTPDFKGYQPLDEEITPELLASIKGTRTLVRYQDMIDKW